MANATGSDWEPMRTTGECGRCAYWQHFDHALRRFIGTCEHMAHDGEARDRFDGCDDFFERRTDVPIEELQ